MESSVFMGTQDGNVSQNNQSWTWKKWSCMQLLLSCVWLTIPCYFDSMRFQVRQDLVYQSHVGPHRNSAFRTWERAS
jgi:hypothetical protein